MKNKNKQAIILIHGIGEQTPMSTLRGFVEAIKNYENNSKPDDLQVEPYSKPDWYSNSYELRRFNLKKESESEKKGSLPPRPSTDFFEYYWAHKMKDTQYFHVIPWLIKLFFKSRSNLKKSLQPLWWKIVFYILFSILLAINLGFYLLGIYDLQSSFWKVVVWIPYFLYPVWIFYSNKFILKYMGDAARYLSPDPHNVEVRQSIRAGGIELLKKLHDSKKYSRIIVVGHSLGSVIGYDILTHYWARVNPKFYPPNDSNQDFLEAMEKVLIRGEHKKELSQKEKMDFQKLQHEVWKELRRNQNPWRVTDFVTLGSPLTHAQFLLGDSKKELQLRQQQRELPTCPPIMEDNKYIGYQESVLFKMKEKDDPTKEYQRNIRPLHHAALFAVTRWTNIYFPGDIIGGELKGVFGKCIFDMPVRLLSKKDTFKMKSHTQYWEEISKKELELIKTELIELQKDKSSGQKNIIYKNKPVPRTHTLATLEKALWLNFSNNIKRRKPEKHSELIKKSEIIFGE